MDFQCKIGERFIELYDINLNNLNTKIYGAILRYDLNASEIIDLVRCVKSKIEDGECCNGL